MDLTSHFLERVHDLLERIGPVVDYAQGAAIKVGSDMAGEFAEIRQEVRDIKEDYALLHGLTAADLAEEKYT
jgi:hypothetical protein